MANLLVVLNPSGLVEMKVTPESGNLHLIYLLSGLTSMIIASGIYHSMKTNYSGKAWGWGYNYDGQLGNYNTLDKCVPTA